MRSAAKRRTICEVLREINDLHQGDGPHDALSRELAVEAMAMAKRMDLRLKDYNKEWDAKWWEENVDYEEDLERRLGIDYLSREEAEALRGSGPYGHVPSQGGREASDRLRALARELFVGAGPAAIVELGPWLGAGTAHLMLGALESGSRVEVHAYDRFAASSSEVIKATKQGVPLRQGQDTLPVFKRYLAGLATPRVSLHAHKGDIASVRLPPDLPVLLYVDDACKRAAQFDRSIRVFSPRFVPGKTALVLMDYWYFEKKPADLGLRHQRDWANARVREGKLEVIDRRLRGVSAAVFRWLES